MTQEEIFYQLNKVNENGGNLIIKIPVDISNIIKYYELKKMSHENLFNTCIVNNDQISNEFNIKRFLKEYEENYILLNNYMRQNLKNILGDKGYEFICINKFSFEYDTSIDILRLFKK